MVAEPIHAESAQASDDRSARWLRSGGSWLAVAALFTLSWRYMDLLGDSFWSVATGRFILEHARLPTSDPFSFTANRPWIVHMPLSQVLFAWVSLHLGILALELFGTLVFGAALVALWLPHARSPLARRLVFPLLVLLIVIQKDDLCVRGQIFGDLAFAVLLICGFRMRVGKRVHPGFALLLGSAWINLHSSSFLCVVVPLAWALVLRFESVDARPPLRPFLEFAAGAALGLLLNPYGVRLIVDLLRLFSSSSTHSIDLFRPPDFASPLTLLAFLVLGVSAAWCYRKPEPRVGAGFAEAILVIGWAIAAASARRYVPLALGFSIALLARRASAAWVFKPSRGVDLVFAGVAACAAFWGMSTDRYPLAGRAPRGGSGRGAARPPGPNCKRLSLGRISDYAWDGRRRVFVDGRNQLFEHGAFEDEQRLSRLENWREDPGPLLHQHGALGAPLGPGRRAGG